MKVSQFKGRTPAVIHHRRPNEAKGESHYDVTPSAVGDRFVKARGLRIVSTKHTATDRYSKAEPGSLFSRITAALRRQFDVGPISSRFARNRLDTYTRRATREEFRTDKARLLMEIEKLAQRMGTGMAIKE